MASARYWRLVGLSTVGGGDLELSELHLYDGATRVGASVTPTCSHAPAAGALANLTDDDLDTTCRFDAAAVRSGGFFIEWDFGGSPTQVNMVRPGSSTDRAAYLAGATLQYRSAASDVWTTVAQLGQFDWPGPSELSDLMSVFTGALMLHGDGVDGSSIIIDSSPAARLPSALGSALISTTPSGAFGGAAIRFTGAPMKYAHTADLSPAGDFCVKFRIWVSSAAAADYRIILIKAAATGHRPYSLQIAPSGVVQAQCSNTAPSIVTLESASTLTSSGWTWIEFNRIGGTLRLFLDGSLEDSDSQSGSNYFNSSDPLVVGGSATAYFLGAYGAAYIDELSIDSGGGASSSYTPPTGPMAGFAPFDRRTPADLSRCAFSASVPAAKVRSNAANRLARDMEFGGAGIITGQTLVKDGGPEVPTRARVRLLRARDGVPARETWSDPATGAYSFTGLDTGQQFVALAQKPDGAYEPVAGGPLTPQLP